MPEYNYTEIRNSLAMILSNLKHDDYKFARTIMRTEKWSINQAKAIYNLLKNNQEHLAKRKIVFSSLPSPFLTNAETQKKIEKRIATAKDGRIYLDYDIDRSNFEHEISIIRNIPGRQYHGDIRQWSIPINKYSYDTIKKLNYDTDPELDRWYTGVDFKDETNFTVKWPVGLTPYPYQVTGVQRLEKFNGRSLLADEMRLGKTIQALLYLYNHPEIRPAIIIVPATLKIQWSQECSKWIPGEKNIILDGRGGMPVNSKDNIIVINYDVVWDYREKLSAINAKIIILDESHKIKNKSAKRTRGIKYLAKGVEHMIHISGTPITNRPSEFFTSLNMISPEMFASEQKFLDEFCDYYNDPTGKGASNTERLHKILTNSFMIRRLRSEVFPDLPDKMRSIVPFELSNRTEYDEAKKDIIKYIRENFGGQAAVRASFAEAIVRFNRLRQLSVKGKIAGILEWIEDYIEQEKLVVFCVHRETVELIYNHFKDKAVKLYGGDSAKSKDEAIQSFQNDDNTRLFVGNILSAGVGIPLWAADNTAFVEFDWVPGNHDQAEDRVINVQKKKPTMAYYLVGLDTIDEEMARIIDSKRKVLTSILDGQTPQEDSMVSLLINKYKGE